MPYDAGLREAKHALSLLEQARLRSGGGGNSSHYTVARERLLEKIDLYERLTTKRV